MSPPQPPRRRWLLALALAVSCSSCDAAHVRAPILDIDELLEASSHQQQQQQQQQQEPISNNSNSNSNKLRGGAKTTSSLDATRFNKEEIAIELQENEQAIERKPEVVVVVEEEEEVEEEESTTTTTTTMEAFLKEEADIERQQLEPPQQQQQQQQSQSQLRRRAIRTNWSENLNQKTHKTALNSFYHSDPQPNRPVTETTGMHYNKVAQQMFFEEDLIDEMMGATIMQMSMGR